MKQSSHRLGSLIVIGGHDDIFVANNDGLVIGQEAARLIVIGGHADIVIVLSVVKLAALAFLKMSLFTAFIISAGVESAGIVCFIESN